MPLLTSNTCEHSQPSQSFSPSPNYPLCPFWQREEQCSKPQMLPNENILAFKSTQSCRSWCSLPSSDSSLLSGDGVGCTHDPLEGCNRIPPIHSHPRHKASRPLPSHTPELPLHTGISANPYSAVGDLPWVTTWFGTEIPAPEMF